MIPFERDSIPLLLLSLLNLQLGSILKFFQVLKQLLTAINETELVAQD